MALKRVFPAAASPSPVTGAASAAAAAESSCAYVVLKTLAEELTTEVTIELVDYETSPLSY